MSSEHDSSSIRDDVRDDAVSGFFGVCSKPNMLVRPHEPRAVEREGMQMEATVVRVEGTAFDQGVQQGKALAASIRANVALIERLISGLDGVTEAEYNRLLNANAHHLGTSDPEEVEEMTGIAEGAGLPLASVLRINLPIYMLLERANVVDECSILAVQSKATLDGRTYLVKTRDQSASRFHLKHVVLSRSYPNGRRILELNGAGIITYPGSGVNETGLMVGTAGAWSKRAAPMSLRALHAARVMPDMHMVLREAYDVRQAVEVLTAAPRTANLNIVLADRTGAAGTLEVTPTEARFTAAVDGYCCLTNYFVSADMQERSAQPDENPAAYLRRERIMKVLAEKAPGISYRDLLELLTDHADKPLAAVCRHPIPGSDMATTIATIATAEELRMHTIEGFPCQALLGASIDA